MGSQENPLEGLIKNKPIRSVGTDFEGEGNQYVYNTERKIKLTSALDDQLYCVCQKPWTGELLIGSLDLTIRMHFLPQMVPSCVLKYY